jgi:hypothetical protein
LRAAGFFARRALVAFRTGARRALVFLAALRFAVERRALVLRAVDFRAGFFAAGFFAVDFLAADFFAAGFFAVVFFAAGFFAAVFFTVIFFAAGFLAAVFFTVAFFAAGFFAAAFFTVAFLAAGFFAAVFFGAFALFAVAILISLLPCENSSLWRGLYAIFNVLPPLTKNGNMHATRGQTFCKQPMNDCESCVTFSTHNDDDIFERKLRVVRRTCARLQNEII